MKAMAYSGAKGVVLALLCANALPQLAYARSPPRFLVNVGFFQFRMNDTRLPSAEQIQLNTTIIEALYTYFWPPLSPPEKVPPFTIDEFENQLDDLEANGQTWFTHDDRIPRERGQAVTDQLLGTLNSTRNVSFPDEAAWNQGVDLNRTFSTILTNFYEQATFYQVGAWMGVGWTIECSETINNVIARKPEWEKAGSAAATTLLALVPALLTFGNLYVPRYSEAFGSSVLIGLTSAAYSLGLPVTSISAIKGNNNIYIPDLDWERVEELEAYGSTAVVGSLALLQSWTSSGTGGLHQRQFSRVRHTVNNWASRWHLWHVPAFLFFAAQVVIFIVAIAPLFFSLGTPIFLFQCYTDFPYSATGLYTIISGIANAIFRLLIWTIGYHENMKIYPLSKTARESLREVIRQPGFYAPTTAEQQPPVFLPLVARAVHLYSRIRNRFYKAVPSEISEYEGGKHNFSNVAKRLKVTLQDSLHRPSERFQDGTVGMLHPPRSVDERQNISKKHPSAYRFRPVVVLFHMSESSKNLILRCFTGVIEAALILVLTFFFAAQWGGNLIITFYAVLLLLVFVTLGRALSLIYVNWSTNFYGLHVVECDSREQMKGALRVMASMQGVLITVNGAAYFDGYRLDNVPAFEEWRLSLARGDFDDGLPIELDTEPKSPAASNLSGAQSEDQKSGLTFNYQRVDSDNHTEHPSNNIKQNSGNGDGQKQ